MSLVLYSSWLMRILKLFGEWIFSGYWWYGELHVDIYCSTESMRMGVCIANNSCILIWFLLNAIFNR